jgi:hypothetical protein
MICNRRRWLGHAHEFGLIGGRWPFQIANDRDAKGKQDKKFDHYCGGYSPPTDSAVVLLLAIEYLHRCLRSLRRSAVIAGFPWSRKVVGRRPPSEATPARRRLRPPERLLGFENDVAPGKPDIVQVTRGQFGQLTPLMLALPPDMQGFAEIG